MFIPSRNLDEVSTYNHMALMSLRRRSRVKASMVLTKADHLFIHNYIRELLNMLWIYFKGSNPCPTACVFGALAN